ncbi:hypothetical protein PIB30_061747 [Stylosanthes scabra]|uniref:Uncharacterized protein n=1 Tax=Stylosanthes scabra TaxID=79078 RepID=A0ABU6SKX9_9FABA|nr:hypothetical protein [Stylosanthes scabra]
MAEVEAMGFGSLQHILEWIVNQEIYTYLASKFDLDNNVIKDDVANVEINAEIVERALRLPSCGISKPFLAKNGVPLPEAYEMNKFLCKVINLKIKELNNSNLPRFTKKFYCVEFGILDTILSERNLTAYETRGEYIGMNPNLGLDKEKAATRQWICDC